jgi:Competence protein CoiA-like family
MNQLLLWGKDAAADKLVSIQEAENGIACKLRCPACSEPLVAKQGQQIQWHFAHASGLNCEGAIETALHRLAKEIIANASRIRLSDNEYFAFSTANIEAPIDNYRVDVLLTNTLTSQQLIVEIFVTHLATASKINQLNHLDYTVLEVDLSAEDPNIEVSKLTDLVLECPSNRELHKPRAPIVGFVPKINWGAVAIALIALAVFVWFVFLKNRRRARQFSYRF